MRKPPMISGAMMVSSPKALVCSGQNGTGSQPPRVLSSQPPICQNHKPRDTSTAEGTSAKPVREHVQQVREQPEGVRETTKPQRRGSIKEAARPVGSSH